MKVYLKKSLSLMMVLLFAVFTVAFGVKVNAASYAEAEFSEGKLLITTLFNGSKYYLPATTTNSGPSAQAFSDASEIGEEHLWTITATGSNYYIQNNEGKYLYTTNTNNGVRVGDTANAWSYDASANSFKDTVTNRYLGIYNAENWRCYTTVNQSNYKESSTSFVFFKLSDSSSEISEFTVTFDSDGGTAVDSQVVEINGYAVKPINPEKNGYIFLGWYLDDVEYDFNTAITKNITLTAKWQFSGYEYVFESKQFSANNETVTLNEVDWTLTGDSEYYGYDSTKGQQLGKEKDPFKEGALTTSGFRDKYVTSVTVNMSGASSIAATVKVRVGDNYLLNDGSETISLTSTATEYTFTAENYAEGDLVIEWTQTSSKAVYIKSILITYEEIPSDLAFDIEFNSNGGSEVIGMTGIKRGSLIQKPADPTLDGYDFLGWYSDIDLTDKWDFDVDVVTSNLTLYAKWEVAGLTNTLIRLNNIQSYLSMAFCYKVEGVNNFVSTDDVLTRATTGITSTSYSSWTSTGTSGASYSGQSAGGNSSIQLRSTNSNSGIVTTVSGGTITKVTVTWNSNTSSGRQVDVYASNTPFTDPTDMYNSKKSDAKNVGSIIYGSTTELVIPGEYQYVGIRSNSGALYLTNVTFTWGKGENTKEFPYVDFRMKFGVDFELNQVTSELKEASYGISIKADGKEVKIPIQECNVEIDNETDKRYSYVIFQLGDVLNNHERLIIDFTVTSYVEVNGETYYSEKSKTYSIKSLMEYYLNISIADHLRNIYGNATITNI